MEDELLSRAKIVRDARAAAALSDPMLRRLVLSFVGESRSLSDTSAITGLDLRRLHHHVTRLCAMGLIEVAAEKPRRGRPVKLYRATAESFFIPYDVAPEPFTEGLSRELRGLLAVEHLQRGDGIFLTVDQHRVPKMRLLSQSPPTARGSELWRILRLNAREAEALRRELKQVLDRHAALSGGRGKPYLVHAAIAQRSAHTITVDNPKVR